MSREDKIRELRIREMRIRQARAALAEGGVIETEKRSRRVCKLSSVMAMLLGILVTLEIMVAGTMILNIDIRTADTIAMFFAFIVVYFVVVATLTDK